jgi:hypothetical protein
MMPFFFPDTSQTCAKTRARPSKHDSAQTRKQQDGDQVDKVQRATESDVFDFLFCKSFWVPYNMDGFLHTSRPAWQYVGCTLDMLYRHFHDMGSAPVHPGITPHPKYQWVVGARAFPDLHLSSLPVTNQMSKIIVNGVTHEADSTTPVWTMAPFSRNVVTNDCQVPIQKANTPHRVPVLVVLWQGNGTLVIMDPEFGWSSQFPLPTCRGPEDTTLTPGADALDFFDLNDLDLMPSLQERNFESPSLQQKLERFVYKFAQWKLWSLNANRLAVVVVDESKCKEMSSAYAINAESDLNTPESAGKRCVSISPAPFECTIGSLFFVKSNMNIHADFYHKMSMATHLFLSGWWTPFFLDDSIMTIPTSPKRLAKILCRLGLSETISHWACLHDEEICTDRVSQEHLRSRKELEPLVDKRVNVSHSDDTKSFCSQFVKWLVEKQSQLSRATFTTTNVYLTMLFKCMQQDTRFNCNIFNCEQSELATIEVTKQNAEKCELSDDAVSLLVNDESDESEQGDNLQEDDNPKQEDESAQGDNPEQDDKSEQGDNPEQDDESEQCNNLQEDDNPEQDENLQGCDKSEQGDNLQGCDKSEQGDNLQGCDKSEQGDNLQKDDEDDESEQGDNLQKDDEDDESEQGDNLQEDDNPEQNENLQKDDEDDESEQGDNLQKDDEDDESEQGDNLQEGDEDDEEDEDEQGDNLQEDDEDDESNQGDNLQEDDEDDESEQGDNLQKDDEDDEDDEDEQGDNLQEEDEDDESEQGDNLQEDDEDNESNQGDNLQEEDEDDESEQGDNLQEDDEDDESEQGDNLQEDDEDDESEQGDNLQEDDEDDESEKGDNLERDDEFDQLQSSGG